MKYKICTDIEKALDQKIETASEFDMLSEMIFERTKEYISATTLKRMWGYLKEDVNPRKTTLNALARFLGYKNYSVYEQIGNGAQSDYVATRRLTDRDLQRGALVNISWAPDRRCVICHDGDGTFHVVESHNTKLVVGDIFRCHLIIEHEPMYMDHLSRKGVDLGCYVVGSRDGVSFHVN